MDQKRFGTTKDGIEIMEFLLKNKHNMQVRVINYGAILVGIEVPDRNGMVEDVVLGYDTLEEYEVNPPYFGAAIGPSSNRIAKASYTINGNSYQLVANNGENNLHTHSELGFHKRIWDVKEVEGDCKVVLQTTCKDGELGFTGNRNFQITYELTKENELKIMYDATSDTETLINMTNHSYFNLAGKGDVLDHQICLQASYYTPTYEDSIPTGEIASVVNTPFNFLQEKRIGEEVDMDHPQLRLALGYDHNYVLDSVDGTCKEFGYLVDHKSGRKMVMKTDLPGVQVYSGNFLEEQVGKKKATYDKRSGICFETQVHPNAINEPNFPSVIYGPNRPYHTETSYQFLVES
ncbi:MAG: aldose epimerase family protein [Eubacteriales bacterium]